MPSFRFELTRGARAARAMLSTVALAALATSALQQAHAAAVSGQGTWETTLQGRDLDGNAATFEAYYDTVLNITWLADANYAQSSGHDADGRMTWEAANTWAAQLNVSGVTGWRLPDVKPLNGSSFNYKYADNGSTDYGYNITSTQHEFSHLYYVTLGNKGLFGPSNVMQQGAGMRNTGPFRNVSQSDYWSGVAYEPDSRAAWYDGSSNGVQGTYVKSGLFSAWAVHSGDVAAVPEPQTYALALVGLAAAGLLARKRRA